MTATMWPTNSAPDTTTEANSFSECLTWHPNSKHTLSTPPSPLKIAGWIEIERDDPTAGLGLLSMDRTGGPALVRIEADASKDPELLDAAVTLASALNAEGIAATVNAKTDTANAEAIHILIGPKP